MSRWLARPLEVRVPLKVVLAGEYTVLDRGGLGVVAAIDRHVVCRASPALSGVTVASPSFSERPFKAQGPLPDGTLELAGVRESDRERFRFVREALELSYRYVAELGLTVRPLRLEIDGEAGWHTAPDGARRKLGLGSSAATTLSVIGATLALHGVPIDRSTYREGALKLALVAHTRAQAGRGSGIDVAAGMAGGVVAYSRGDEAWLRSQLAKGAGPLELARGAWPSLQIEPIRAAPGLRLLVGFTGKASATVDNVRVYEGWRRARRAEHAHFRHLSREAVRALVEALQTVDNEGIVEALGRARRALRFLESKTGMEIETPALKRLADIAVRCGGAGKLSGAGGGDCGIAVAFERDVARRIEEAWREAGILPIEARMAPTGMTDRILSSAPPDEA